MPSVSDKQRKFMGAELARKRAGKSTQTGMSDEQLSEFAGSVVHKSKKDKPGRSIVDVEIHNRKPSEGSIEIHGHYAKPGQECHEAESTHEQLASYKARDSHNLGSYNANVRYLGPDSDFRTEEINPHHYGRDYEPSPYKDYWKTGDMAEELGLRMREEYKYAKLATPGSVPDKAPPSVLAYGTSPYNKIKREVPDNRSFDSQQEFRRQHDELDEDMPENDPIIKKYRHR